MFWPLSFLWRLHHLQDLRCDLSTFACPNSLCNTSSSHLLSGRKCLAHRLNDNYPHKHRIDLHRSVCTLCRDGSRWSCAGRWWMCVCARLNLIWALSRCNINKLQETSLHFRAKRFPHCLVNAWVLKEGSNCIHGYRTWSLMGKVVYFCSVKWVQGNFLTAAILCYSETWHTLLSPTLF